MTPEQLKASILKSAFSGKLVKSRNDDRLPNVKEVVFEESPFEIPDNWIWSLLGNCCNMYTGNSISERVKKIKYTGISEGLDYIATKDVGFDNTVIYDNGIRIPLDENFKVAKANSVLMCIEGGSAGRKIGLIDRDVCFGNKLCMFNSIVIENKYIFYYLQSSEFKKSFTGNISGIIGGVSIKKLKVSPIPIPSVEEQKRIVAKIEELLPYVDRYAIAYEKLEQLNAKFPDDMRKSILQYAIQGKLVEQRAEEGTGEELYQKIQEEKQRLIKDGKIKKEKPLQKITDDEIPFDIPDSWKWVRLEKAIFLLSGSDLESGRYNEKGLGIPYITGASNIDDNRLIINRWTDSPNNRAKMGDLLLTCKGTVGKTHILQHDEVHIARQLMAITPILINIEYLHYFIQSSIKTLRTRAKSMIPGIERKNVLGLITPIPPLEEQKRIVARIEELLAICDRLKNKG